MDERLTDLEINYMRLGRTVEELSDLVYSQQQSILRLEGELAALKEQFLVVAPSLVKPTQEEEPPPHY